MGMGLNTWGWWFRCLGTSRAPGNLSDGHLQPLLSFCSHAATQATAPQPCQGDPMSWCWDMATTKHCGWEQQCQDLWNSLALVSTPLSSTARATQGYGLP